ncbi:hypothetical protein FB567DRAFT_518611 [Paraphoma chrysanthemicola]|uniref:Uncharacterized protein n=1 Tax=Paraphoma chrysanthemicola TaxID=798071 RepID=A0A8K0RCK5_9PLEO|nr:hypothetical protein FB567DRAFT_518611 [Paraphoma chrysanthemicola]
MVPTSSTLLLTRSTTTSAPAIMSHTALPGIKRGIAIGAACSITILLITILALFAFRHRRRTPRTDRLSQETLIESCVVQQMCWRFDRAPSSEPEPAKTIARTIHELDASDACQDAGPVHEMMQEERRVSWEHDDDRICMPEMAQRLDKRTFPTWQTAGYQDSRDTLPTVFVTPPEEKQGDVSPMIGPSPLPTTHIRTQERCVYYS